MMDTPVKQAVFAEFARLLADHPHGYKRAKVRFPKRTAFARVIKEGFSTFVVVVWHGYRDQFTLEVAWNYKGSLDLVCSMYDPDAAVKMNGALVPVTCIMGLTEAWWEVPTSVGADGLWDVSNTVRKAFGVLVAHGLPYLDGIVAAKCGQ